MTPQEAALARKEAEEESGIDWLPPLQGRKKKWVAGPEPSFYKNLGNDPDDDDSYPDPDSQRNVFNYGSHYPVPSSSSSGSKKTRRISGAASSLFKQFNSSTAKNSAAVQVPASPLASKLRALLAEYEDIFSDDLQ